MPLLYLEKSIEERGIWLSDDSWQSFPYSKIRPEVTVSYKTGTGIFRYDVVMFCTGSIAKRRQGFYSAYMEGMMLFSRKNGAQRNNGIAVKED